MWPRKHLMGKGSSRTLDGHWLWPLAAARHLGTVQGPRLPAFGSVGGRGLDEASSGGHSLGRNHPLVEGGPDPIQPLRCPLRGCVQRNTSHM